MKIFLPGSKGQFAQESQISSKGISVKLQLNEETLITIKGTKLKTVKLQQPKNQT